MKKDAIAVLEIGKDNKTILIYDKQMRIIEKNSKVFGEIKDNNGLLLEQPEVSFLWFLGELKRFSKQFNIRAISVTTHGAMGVCTDAAGNITCPPLAYTNEPGSQFCESFFKEFGDRDTLQTQTATIEIGEMINFAKILYYCKQNFPEKFKATKHILLYPQYFGFKLTGIAATEHTSLGCHTYLYDAQTNAYSSVAHKLGIIDKMPKEISNSWDTIGTVTKQIAEECDLPKDCIVTAGIQDSNSILLPFLTTETEDFILNSIGTWGVTMKPVDKVCFKDQELGKTVFYHRDVFGNPVKSSIFLDGLRNGLEYDTYSKRFGKVHNRSDIPKLDKKLYQSLFDKCQAFILPSVSKGAGLLPPSKARLIDGDTCISPDDFEAKYKQLSFLNDYELSMAVLTSSLVIQTSLALDYTAYNDGDQIFVQGVFAENQTYLDLLAAFHPNSKVFVANVKDPIPLGAAILALAAIEKKSPEKLELDIKIEKTRVENKVKLRVDAYKKKFFELI